MRSIDISGKTYNNGKLVVVRKLPKTGTISIYECHCTECAKDPELNGLALYSARKGELDRGVLPCACSSRTNWSPEQYGVLVRRASSGTIVADIPISCKNGTKVLCTCTICQYKWKPRIGNVIHMGSGCPNCAGNAPWTEADLRAALLDRQFKLIGFTGKISTKSKIELECAHGHRWMPTVRDVTNGGYGCPDCAGNRKILESTAIDQINAICADRNWIFHGWIGSWKGHRTVMDISCQCGCRWRPWYNPIISGRTGCPQCSHNGFNPSVLGYLYLYRWDHPTLPSFLKYGITNYPAQRIQQQQSKSKHVPTLIILVEFENGRDAQDIERDIKRLRLPIGAVKADFSDGWTETTTIDSLSVVMQIISRDNNCTQT